jgi:hypothetical protein
MAQYRTGKGTGSIGKSIYQGALPVFEVQGSFSVLLLYKRKDLPSISI